MGLAGTGMNGMNPMRGGGGPLPGMPGMGNNPMIAPYGAMAQRYQGMVRGFFAGN